MRTTQRFGIPAMRTMIVVLLSAAWLGLAQRAAALTPRAALLPPSPGVRASWGYAALNGIGEPNIVVSAVGTVQRIYSGAEAYGGNAFWIAMQYSSASQSYEQIFVSPDLGDIRQIAAADVVGDTAKEIVVAAGNGDVLIYDEATLTLLGRLPAAITALTAMTCFDFDLDGKAEILLSADGNIDLYHGDGTVEWSLQGTNATGFVVAQMDGDAGFEIATREGLIIDSDTRTVEWTLPPTYFGYEIDAGDVDGDGRAELIAARNDVKCYDVDEQKVKWTVALTYIGTIRLANVDADAGLELLIGRGQPGSVLALDTTFLTVDWTIPNPDYGVADVAAGDVDGDGAVEIIWGALSSSSGPEMLRIADAATQTIEWQSPWLYSMSGPQIGDIDGDGQPEIVAASSWLLSSDAPKVLVFDGATRELRAVMYLAYGQASMFYGILDLKLRNVDADPALEIVVGTSNYYDGVVHIYDFDAATNTLTLKWQNATRPGGSPFYAVEVADIDLDGQLEIVAGGSRVGSNSPGPAVYVYDYATGVEEWRSAPMAPLNRAVSGLAVLSNGAGSPEVMALVPGGSVYVFDGVTKETKAVISAQLTAFAPRVTPAAPRGFFVMSAAGILSQYEKAGAGYSAITSRSVPGANPRITQFPSGALAVFADSRMLYFASATGPLLWTSAPYRIFETNNRVVEDATGSLIFSGSYAVLAIAPAPIVASVTPASGPSGGGTQVTISGERFPTPAAVRFGGIDAAAVTVNGETSIEATTPELPPGTLNDVAVVRLSDDMPGVLVRAFFSDFLDVPQADPLHDFVEKIFRHDITAGCGGGLYCSGSPVLRSQMAIFLLRGIHGGSYVPPPPTGTRFTDVPSWAFGSAFIEELAAEGITGGCTATEFCPNSSVLRSQMAVFLLRSEHGSSYVPPPATGIFLDVPVTNPFAAWIEQLFNEGITSGCAPDLYCPSDPVSRGQMAVFLTRTFGF